MTNAAHIPPGVMAGLMALVAGLVGSALTAWHLRRRVSRLENALVLFEAERCTSRQLGERLENQVEDWHGTLSTKNAELEQSLQALRQTQQQLVVSEKMASLGTLSAGVAHEINNPLAFVSSNLAFVREQLEGVTAFTRPGGETSQIFHSTAEEALELRRALDEALEGSKRIANIVADLKTFCRTDDTRLGAVDLAQSIESALRMVHLMVLARARVVREFERVPPVAGHPGKLAQAILNLLVNAALAIPEGAAGRNEIRVRLAAGKPGTVVAEVTDTGVGIPPEIRHRLFEPFFTTRPVGGGTGLGLSVSQGIVQSMGGSIEFESEVGRGSTFRIILPTHATEEVRFTPPPPSSGSGSSTVSQASGGSSP